MRLSWAIAIVLLIGCCWSVIAIASAAEDRAADREKVLEHIKELGGKYTVDDKQPGQPVVTVDLRGRNNLVDSDLDFLALIPEVQELNLSNTGVTDDCLQHIAAHTTSERCTWTSPRYRMRGSSDCNRSKNSAPCLYLTRTLPILDWCR